MNTNIYDKLGETSVLPIYALSIFFTAVGYLSLILVKKSKYYYLIDVIFKLLFLISLGANVFITNQILTIILSILSTFTFGYIGSLVYYKISMSLNESYNNGKILGISIALALILQTITYNLINNYKLILIPIYISTIVLLFFINKTNDNKVTIIRENNYKNIDELILAIDDYINYYNYDRIKEKLKGLSPVNYRLQSSN